MTKLRPCIALSTPLVTATTAVVLLGALAVARPTAAQQITVGPNVHVTKDRSTIVHNEFWAGGDWTNPDRLIACSMTEDGKTRYYASHDRGKTWKVTLELSDGVLLGDPVCEFGLDGTAYAITLSINPSRPVATQQMAGLRKNLTRQVQVYRSADGGRTWEAEPARFEFIDREAFAVDNTGGKYHGRLYIIGTTPDATLDGEDNPRTSLRLYRSLDGGRTFLGPVFRVAGESSAIAGKSAVLSDGTFIAPVNIGIRPSTPTESGDRCSVQIIRSTDGGETFGPATKVADSQDCDLTPHLAADRSGGPFHDRAYLVWRDLCDGRTCIRLSYSTDRGQTWSAPQQVSDARARAGSPRRTPVRIPVVEVNKHGVVGVSWYDPRDRQIGGGSDLRFAASLDGGETFTPSVRVSEPPGPGQTEVKDVALSTTWTSKGSSGVTVYFNLRAGHPIAETNGMAVGADGTFHPVWNDVRTGVAQMWTAPVTVRGVVAQHGATALADLVDVSEHVTIEATDVAFDRKAGIMTTLLRVKNTAATAVRGPLKLRLMGLEFEGSVDPKRVRETENGITGVGAVWDWSALLGDGVLAPGEETPGRQLAFRVTYQRYLGPLGEQMGEESARVVFRVLAGGVGQEKP
jgi:hypothetical protein